MDRFAEKSRLYATVQVPLELAVRASLNFNSTLSPLYDREKFLRVQQAAGILGDAFNAVADEKIPLDRAKAALRDRLPALGTIAREFEGSHDEGWVRQLKDGQARLAETLAADLQR